MVDLQKLTTGFKCILRAKFVADMEVATVKGFFEPEAEVLQKYLNPGHRNPDSIHDNSVAVKVRGVAVAGPCGRARGLLLKTLCNLLEHKS